MLSRKAKRSRVKTQKIDIQLEYKDAPMEVELPTGDRIQILVKPGCKFTDNGQYTSTIVEIIWLFVTHERFEVFLGIGGNDFSHRGRFHTNECMKHEIPCEARQHKDGLQIRLVNQM
jgi:hypothetical protein